MRGVDISYRNILRITSPVLLSSFSYTAMGILDTVMVGRLGVTELAAVGLGNILCWWVISFFFGLLNGVNTFVAQAVGAGDDDRVARCFWQGLILGVGSGVLMVGGGFLLPAVLAKTGAEPALVEAASRYVYVRAFGGLGVGLLFFADNFYRGLGQTEVPMWGSWAKLVLNCGFNYLFIYGKAGFPALGVAGAALGTVIADAVVGVSLLALLTLPRWSGRFPFGPTRVTDMKLLRQMLVISFPIGVQIFMELGGISLFSAVVARLGTNEMAITNTVIQAWSIAFMIMGALAVGATTMVGHAIGASAPEAARTVTERIFRLGAVASVAVGVFYVFWPEALLRLFVSPDDVAALVPFARPLFLVVTACLLPDLRFNVLSGAMRGAGDTTYSMLVNVGSAWLIFVPLTIFSASRWGLVGAWSCFFVHVSVMALLLEFRFRGRRWFHRVVSDQVEELDVEELNPAATASLWPPLP